MSASPDFLLLLLLVFLALAALVAIVLFISFRPRFLRRDDRSGEALEMNTVMGAFSALGSELQSLKEQLIIRERLAALGEVSAGIAHELRNPLGVIAGYAKLLMKQYEGNDPRQAAGRAAAESILKEVEAMNRVMEELLRFSRPEPISKKEIRIAPLMRDLVAEQQGAEKRISCAVDDALVIRADETLLKQAMRNLVQNACDAGTNIGVAAEPCSAGGRAAVCLSVSDDGPGIANDHLSKVFMPFFTTKSGGAGIGLALVHKIVTAHGGTVAVESGEGRGSTFRVVLPLQ
ncbi:MAG: ATP-binding protein [Nitrospirota bacterium]